MNFIKNNRILLLLTIFGSFLRFYNLNWGAPFFFHPDERNIIVLILGASLSDPASLFQGTFAYGNFPVLLTLILKPIFLPFLKIQNIVDPFTQTGFIIRFFSASFSVATLYIIYLSGKFFSKKTGLLALFLATFSTGFIQQAHFGTYDGSVAFFSIISFYFILKFTKTKHLSNFYFSILFIALNASAKINLLILNAIPFFLILKSIRSKKLFLKKLPHLVAGFFLLVSLTIILSPNYLSHNFLNSLIYERGLVTGELPVFYTQTFTNTIPVIFQFTKIFPFLINPVLTILFIPSFFYVLLTGINKKNISYLLLVISFLLLFIPQSFLFAKWTRYMIPTLPFIYLIIAIAISDLLKKYKEVLSIKYLVFSLLLTSSVMFAVSYFITAFVKQDTRIVAAKFASTNLSSDAKTLTEPYDLGIMPFYNLSNTTYFNFYELDNNSLDANKERLYNLAFSSNYIILPSQRLIRSRILNPDKFSEGHDFYKNLLNENLRFEKIYQSPCDIFCKITYLGNPIFSFEETASVFDRPTVFIFKKK